MLVFSRCKLEDAVKSRETLARVSQLHYHVPNNGRVVAVQRKPEHEETCRRADENIAYWSGVVSELDRSITDHIEGYFGRPKTRIILSEIYA